MLINIQNLSSQYQTENKQDDFGFNQIEKPKINYGSDDDLAKILPELMMGTCIEFFTEGKWSTHHLIAEIIKKIGRCDLVFSTWAITEDSLRTLFRLKQSGDLLSIKALFESKISGHNPKAFGFAKEFFDSIRLSHCHAKVTVLTNESWSLVINSSANWTRNKRIESGTIICMHESALFHKKWILKDV